jgi:hypothetical protein
MWRRHPQRLKHPLSANKSLRCVQWLDGSESMASEMKSVMDAKNILLVRELSSISRSATSISCEQGPQSLPASPQLAHHFHCMLISVAGLPSAKRARIILGDVSPSEQHEPDNSGSPSLLNPLDTPSSNNLFLKTVYHLSSHKPTTCLPITSSAPPKFIPASEALAANPIHPFQSFADFSFASYVVNTRLSRHETSQLLSAQLGNCWSNGPTKLLYRKTGDVLRALDNAAELFDQVQ